ncbi:MAG: hypothetical protein L0211_16190, partial [Planctomycetaceae bacterium]|nr:hypothetical protein [Planctomycetaceae bacterium]
MACILPDELESRWLCRWRVGARLILSLCPVILAAGCALLAASGCSFTSPVYENQKPVHPVRGSVTVGGAPAASAFVLFVPLNEPAEPVDPRPRAEVKEDGTFAISTYGSEDGAPVGEYIVTIVWEDRDLGTS